MSDEEKSIYDRIKAIQSCEKSSVELKNALDKLSHEDPRALSELMNETHKIKSWFVDKKNIGGFVLDIDGSEIYAPNPGLEKTIDKVLKIRTKDCLRQ